MEDLIQKIKSLRGKQPTLLIGIDGLGGAGKSTVANFIKDNIPDTTIVEMDDFYIPELTRDDWDRVYEQVIKPLKTNASASYQRFDWDTKQLAEWHTIESGGVVIVEGVYALHEKLKDTYDYRIWVECPYDIRLKRGLERDGEEARSWWVDEWMPKEEEYKQSQKPQQTADIVIDGSKGNQ